MVEEKKSASSNGVGNFNRLSPQIQPAQIDHSQQKKKFAKMIYEENVANEIFLFVSFSSSLQTLFSMMENFINRRGKKTFLQFLYIAGILCSEC